MKKQSNLDSKVFWPAIVFTFTIVGLAAAMPEKVSAVAMAGMNFVTYDLGWLVQFAGLGCLVFLLWLSFGKYGKVKFGDENDKPEFSNVSYAFLMFTAGVGAGLIYWAIGEPLTYLQSPPMGAEPLSVEASLWAITYPMYHWGPIGWAIFCLPAVPYAYYLHKRKNRNLRLSSLCSDIIGKKRADSWVGNLINIIAIFGTLGAFSTSMGFSADLLAAGLNTVFGIPNTLMLKIGIVISFILFYGVVMIAGMKKGVEKLSNFCVYIAIGLGLYVLFAGPTEFIIAYLVDSLGVMGNNFLRMSLWTDPINQSGFPQGWTIYYWAWYFAYLVMMGLFLARVSKGRTIRELILTCMTAGSIGCMFFISIFGGYAVHGELTGAFPFVEWMNEFGTSQAVINVMKSLPFGSIVLVIFLIAAYFLISTTMTSAAFAVSMMTSKNLDQDAEPDLNVRLAWTVAVGALSMVSLLMGGSIESIKSMCIIAAPPMIILFVIMSVGLVKWLKEDFEDVEQIKERKESSKKVA